MVLAPPLEHIVTDVSELPDLSHHKVLVIDSETSGLDPYMGDRACGIVIGPQHEDEGWYIPIRHSEGNLPVDDVCSWLRQYTHDPEKIWVFHNSKFDMKMLRRDGVEFTGKVVDTMLGAHVLRGDLMPNMFGLDKLTNIFLDGGFEHKCYAKVKELLSHQKIAHTEEGDSDYNYSLLPIEDLGRYALEDLNCTRLLAREINARFDKIVADGSFEPIDNHGCPSYSMIDLLNNEMKLVKTLFEMEDRGVLVDQKKCLQLRDKAIGEIELYKLKLRQLAGFSFEPAAWKQTWIAFEKAGGEILYWTRVKEKRGKQKLQQITMDKDESTGRPNWNAASILKYLQHYPKGSAPYNFVLYYREVLLRERILSTYIEHYLKYSDREGVLHGNFNQHTVITGRLSASRPNLQNVSVKKGTADQKAFEKFTGIKDEDALNRQVRSLFIARPGKVLLTLDWSQVEYRMAAWLSQDARMIEAWQKNPYIDYHEDTVQITGLDRDCCKTINFMVLFGGGATGLAATLSGMGRPTTKQQAQDMLNQLFTARPALRNLISQYQTLALRDHFVMNCFGRVCDVPRGFEYKGLSYAVQGSVGDWMRVKIVEMDVFIKKYNLPVEMLLTVHDEIDFEIPEEEVEHCVPLLMAEMSRCEFMTVPVPCDAELGYAWSDAIPFEEWLETKCGHKFTEENPFKVWLEEKKRKRR